MKKKLLVLLLTIATLSGFGQTWNAILSDTPSTMKATLLSSTESSITVKVQVPGFYTHAVNTPRGEAQLVMVPKAVSTADAGEPDLPMFAIPAIIGDQQHYALRVTEASYTDFPMEVAPSKGDFSRQINPDDVLYTYGNAYRHDAFFPEQRVGLYDPYILRDFRGQNMVVYPFAYNPIRKTLRVYHSLTLELYSDRNEGQNTLLRKDQTVKLDREFKSLYEHRFINYQSAMNRYTPVEETGHLLIICHDAFMDAMEPYIAWKKQIGIPTTMVGTSVAGTTSDVIKSYIQSQYAANPSITHILLVGDSQHIQGYYANNPGYSGRSDNWFGQLVGNDFYNDVIVGRFSAESVNDVTNQVNKVIHYERDIDASDTWLTTGTGVATTAGSGGHFGEDDWQHVDNLRNDLLGYHYTEVYRDYPSGGGASSNASTLSQHINQGVSIINYCNHGSETSWGVFNYSNSHVNALTNVNKLPIVWSVACLVGKYDHYQPCFAETWLRANNGNDVNQPTGAIGGMFSYISQPWVPPMYGQDEMVDVLIESHENNIKRTLGGVSFDGNMKIIDQYGSNHAAGMGTYMCWILYGDPTLTLRNDIPVDMAIDHAPAIHIAATNFEVTAANGEGARATLTLNGEILGSAVINNGVALIECEAPGQMGLATLTVFGYNKITYITEIPIVTGEDDEPVEVTTTANPNIIPRGGSTTLNAQAIGGNWYFSYHWTPEEGLSQANIKSPVATPTVTTTYTCTVTSGSYSNADSCTVTVVCPPANLTATADGSDIILTWDPADPAESYNVYRSSVLIAEGLTETTYTDTDLTPGAYSYRVATNYQGILSPRSGAAAATILAPLTVTTTADPSVISWGHTTTLTATVPNGSGDCTYTWSPAESLSAPDAATTIAAPLETTTYTVTVTRGSESITSELTVQVVTAPTDLDVIVEGTQAELSWTATSMADYFKIYDDGTLIVSNVTETHCVLSDLHNGYHPFNVSAVYEGVESPMSQPLHAEVFVCRPPVNVTATYYWEDNQFGTLVTWQKSDLHDMALESYDVYRGTDPEQMAFLESVPNELLIDHFQYLDPLSEPGTYYYQIVSNYENMEDCGSEIIEIAVTSVEAQDGGCRVYPNPATDRLTVEATGMHSVTLINSLGQTVGQALLEDGTTTLSTSHLVKGVYLLLIQDEKTTIRKKVMIQ